MKKIKVNKDAEFIVAAFYTIDTPYEQEIENLIASLELFNLSYVIKGYKSRGNWTKNCAIKPEFVWEMIQEYPQNIVYVDADAVIKKYPIIFNGFDGDIGVRYISKQELVSGTLFFRNTVDVQFLIKKWVKHQKQHSNIWDQKVLQKIIQDYVIEGRQSTGKSYYLPILKHSKKIERLNIKIVDIPDSYCHIIGSEGEPVIEQFQAARRFKNQINVV